jgi:predicted ATPase
MTRKAPMPGIPLTSHAEPKHGAECSFRSVPCKADLNVYVNLTDVGTGVAQVLPILVQRAIDIVKPPERPILEIVEQPELHLHPAAHGGLADIYISAARRSRTRFIVETHSETFLLRVRRRVAEGVVDPSILAVYFLENSKGIATVRPINIEADGGIDYWPTGIFSEDYEEARAITKAQAQRPNTDAN